MKALETLTDDERFLINELYFNEKSERDLTNITGISQPAVHKRRNKILEKIKKLIIGEVPLILCKPQIWLPNDNII